MKEEYESVYNGKKISYVITETEMGVRADGITPYPLVPDGLGLHYEAGDDYLEIHYPVTYNKEKKVERMERLYKFLVMSFGSGKVEHDFKEIFGDLVS